MVFLGKLEREDLEETLRTFRNGDVDKLASPRPRISGTAVACSFGFDGIW